MGEKKERVYLSVPYVLKDKAKLLGAKWDVKEQMWYIPDDLDERLKEALLNKFPKAGVYRVE